MGNFRQDRGKRFGGGQGGGFGGRDGGRPSFSGRDRDRSSDRDRGPVTMYQAVCSQCGNPCEVPFQPTQGKPVYCDVCFGSKKGDRNNRGGDRFPRKDFNDRKPDRSDFRGSIGGGGNDEVKKQLEILNTKMDRLIKAVESMANIKPSVAEEKEKKSAKIDSTVKIKKLVKKVFKK
jgi:CxxC-x17-CxxC domain-containing protein